MYNVAIRGFTVRERLSAAVGDTNLRLSGYVLTYWYSRTSDAL